MIPVFISGTFVSAIFLKGKSRNLIITLTLIEDVFLIVLNYNFPNNFGSIDEFSRVVNIINTFVFVTIFIILTTNIYLGQFRKQNERLIESNKQISFNLDAEKFVKDILFESFSGENLFHNIDDTLYRLGIFLEADRTFIFEFHGDTVINTHTWISNSDNSENDSLQNLPLSYVEKWIPFLEQKKCIVINDIANSDLLAKSSIKHLIYSNVKSLVIAPIFSDKKLSGFIGISNPVKTRTKTIEDLLLALSYSISTLIDLNSSKKVLESLSFHDSMTKLKNRNAFIQTFKKMDSHKISHNVGIIFIDINGPKETNDSLGHKKGDELIASLATILKNAGGEENTYRIGGDEFIILMQNINKNDFYKISSIVSHNVLNNKSLSISQGIAWKERVSDINGLIDEADQKMYEKKDEYYNNEHHRYTI